MGHVRLLSIGKFAIAAAVALAAAPALAADENLTICDRQGDRDCICGSPEAADRLPELPAGCHKERINAAGELSYGIVRSATYLGRKAWQRQVLEKYGERFQRWDMAACRTIECTPGALAGSKRCTYSGFACSPDVNLAALAELKRARGEGDSTEYRERHESERRADRELGPEEISEMQRLLRRMGYEVAVDGQFGEQTSEALIKWERRVGLPDRGEPTFRILEELRHRGG
jgi:hypothetical protein